MIFGSDNAFMDGIGTVGWNVFTAGGKPLSPPRIGNGFPGTDLAARQEFPQSVPLKVAV
jgi:hypothetical protein